MPIGVTLVFGIVMIVGGVLVMTHWLARKFAGFPTHDWQGYLDTGPIPVVTAPSQRLTSWSAPADPGAGLSAPLPRLAPQPEARVLGRA